MDSRTKSAKTLMREALMSRRRLIRQCLTATWEAILAGEFDAAKEFIRSAIKASGGFPALADALDMSEKSLIRMFGPRGNPQAHNLVAVIAYLQQYAGTSLFTK